MYQAHFTDMIPTHYAKDLVVDGLMENFFGLLKTEMFYGQEYKYHSLKQLKEAIEKYIKYYNEEGIKSRLKGLTPEQFRNQSLVA